MTPESSEPPPGAPGEPIVLVRIRVAGDDPGVSGDQLLGLASRIELAAEALWAQGATGVEVREDPEGATLLAGYPTGPAAREVAGQLDPSFRATVEVVTDDSWRRAWRDWIRPVAVGQNLMVVPSWRPVSSASGRLVLRIDPGDCFGSGTHASTRMLLNWLDAHPPIGLAAVDVGSGSGILAVAAGLLGAASVTAIDVDPAAVLATEANALANGVSDVVRASDTPVAQLAPRQADLVMVNVTAGTHANIGGHCSQALAPGGRLLVAGLLPGQWRHIAGAYVGLHPLDFMDLDGWEGAVLARR